MASGSVLVQVKGTGINSLTLVLFLLFWRGGEGRRPCQGPGHSVRCWPWLWPSTQARGCSAPSPSGSDTRPDSGTDCRVPRRNSRASAAEPSPVSLELGLPRASPVEAGGASLRPSQCRHHAPHRPSFPSEETASEGSGLVQSGPGVRVTVHPAPAQGPCMPLCEPTNTPDPRKGQGP